MMAAGAVSAPIAPAVTPTSSTAPSSATSTDSLPTGTNSVNPRIQFLQDLAEVLKDFSSAEILLALMLARGGCRDDEDHGESAGFAFLAGVAMAGLLYQQLGNLDAQSVSGSYGMTDVSPIGGTLNLSV